MMVERPARRTVLILTALVLLEVLVFLGLVRIDPTDPLSVAKAVAGLLPLLGFLAFLHPWALLLACPLLILVPGNILGFSALDVALLLALTAAALRTLVAGRSGPKLSVIEAVWLCYALWALVSVTQAVELRFALGGAWRTVMTGLAFVAGYRMLGAEHTRGGLRVTAVLACAIGVQLVGTIVVNGYSLDLVATRVLILTNLGWGQSNYVAAVASLAAAGAIALLFFGSSRERVLGILGIVGALIVQITTMSRGGTLALTGGLLLAGLIEARRRILPALLILGAIAMAYFLSPLGQAAVARFLSPEGLPSIGVRLLFFREAFTIWREHWLLGVGPDQIPYHTAVYMDANPHNIFLKQMADFGIVGLALYVALLVLAARKAIWLQRHAVGPRGRMVALALALVVGIAVVNAQYEPTLEGSAYGFIFWLLVGSLVRSADRTREELRRETA